VTRVLSGAVLVLLAISAVWFASAAVFLAIAIALTWAAALEVMSIAKARGFGAPRVLSAVAAVVTLAAIATAESATMAAAIVAAVMIAIGVVTLGRWRPDFDALSAVSVAVFPSIYVALPIALLVAIRVAAGPAALFLLMLTVMISDTAQYYTGRALGRRPLAPAISPKKTIEGAVGGLIFGSMTLVIAGAWWLPMVHPVIRGLVGVAIVSLGIAGDLFESMLKRSAGVKDSSALIPGHGGILDRIDALLFAAPVYYIVVVASSQ